MVRGVRPRRGGVLLVVLGVLAALGVVISLLGSYALERSLLAETRGAEAETEASRRIAGAIEAAVAVVSSFEEVAGTLRHPSEGWGRPAELLEGWPPRLAGIEVEIFDESNRPGLGLLEEEELEKLLAESGFSRGEAAELADLLLDWIDEDDDERLQGRENGPLARDRDPFVANRAPVSWDEVWSIPEWGEAAFDGDGRLRDWARRFAGAFSLEHDGPANVNALDPEVAEWFHDAGLISDPRWLEDRYGPDNDWGSDDDRILEEVPEGAGDFLSSESRLLRVRAGLRAGERYVWREAWIAKEEDGRAGRGEESEAPSAGQPRIEVGGRTNGTDRGGENTVWGGWRLLEVREGLSLVLEEPAEVR